MANNQAATNDEGNPNAVRGGSRRSRNATRDPRDNDSTGVRSSGMAELSTCDGCGATMRWVITAANGKRMPIDPIPNPQGNVLIHQDDNGRDIGTVIGKGKGSTTTLFADEIRFMPHHATCIAVHKYRPVAAAVERDEALAKLERNADEWLTVARTKLHEYLELHAYFHVDHFWEWWEHRNLPMPHTMKAIGPVIMYAAKQHWMKRTGTYKPSIRSHMSEKPVWESLLWKEPSSQ